MQCHGASYGKFRSGRQAPLEYEVTEDTIYGVDFEREIARAMERKDYREAMRFTYLQTLKMLSDHQLIDWQPFKTPNIPTSGKIGISGRLRTSLSVCVMADSRQRSKC